MGYINPLLRLSAACDLITLPTASRIAIAKVLRALRKQANDEAETAWKRRKGPMAAYWRAVATYARHLAHILESAPATFDCDDCRDTGQVCVGTSGRESDGNALEFERCPSCGCGEVATAPAEAREPDAYMTLDCVNLKPSSVYLDHAEVADMRPEHVVPLYRGSAPADAGEAVDAARYRFLRDRMAFVQGPGKVAMMSMRSAMPAPNHDFNKDFMGELFDRSVDETIDAALAAQGAQSEGGDA